MFRECLICKTKYRTYPSRISIGRKYCSHKCSEIGQIGRTPWNKGIKTGFNGNLGRRWKWSDEARKKLIPRYGESNPNWKGGITINKTKYDNERYRNLPDEQKKYISWSKNKRNRLKRTINNGGSLHTWEQWVLLKIKYNLTCPCCHKSEPEITLTEDHIIPLSKGGNDSIENIQPLCLSCNVKKHTNSIKY